MPPPSVAGGRLAKQPEAGVQPFIAKDQDCRDIRNCPLVVTSSDAFINALKTQHPAVAWARAMCALREKRLAKSGTARLSMRARDHEVAEIVHAIRLALHQRNVASLHFGVS